MPGKNTFNDHNFTEDTKPSGKRRREENEVEDRKMARLGMAAKLPESDGQSFVVTSSSPSVEEERRAEASFDPGDKLLAKGTTRPKGRKRNNNDNEELPGLQKPKRALSAYNFFFRDERARILAETTASENEHRKEPGVAQSALVQAKTTKRKGPEPHHKISFERLGKLIGLRWKRLSPEERRKYQTMAEQDSKRHQYEMGEYFDKEDEMKRAALSSEASVTTNDPFNIGFVINEAPSTNANTATGGGRVSSNIRITTSVENPRFAQAQDALDLKPEAQQAQSQAYPNSTIPCNQGMSTQGQLFEMQQPNLSQADAIGNFLNSMMAHQGQQQVQQGPQQVQQLYLQVQQQQQQQQQVQFQQMQQQYHQMHQQQQQQVPQQQIQQQMPQQLLQQQAPKLQRPQVQEQQQGQQQQMPQQQQVQQQQQGQQQQPIQAAFLAHALLQGNTSITPNLVQGANATYNTGTGNLPPNLLQNQLLQALSALIAGQNQNQQVNSQLPTMGSSSFAPAISQGQTQPSHPSNAVPLQGLNDANAVNVLNMLLQMMPAIADLINKGNQRN